MIDPKEDAEKKLNELQKALQYYKKRLDDLGPENLRKEYEITALKTELTLRRRAFTLLSRLGQIIGQTTDVPNLFEMVIGTMSGSLGMDRIFVLTPKDTDITVFRPTYWVGLSGMDDARIEELPRREFQFPIGFSNDANQFLLVHSQTEATPLIAQLRQALDLPHFACVPIIEESKAIGMLVMGRLREGGGMFPKMEVGDVETLQAIARLISAVVENRNVGVLREMDRLKSEFFANISHEFRTPITLTIGPLESMLDGRWGTLSDESRREIELVLRSQRRLLGLINQILDLAKFESGMMRLKPSRIKNFNAFLEKRVEQFRAVAEKRGVQIEIVLDPQVAEADLFIDLEKMDKALFNLLSNAFKFTLKGSIQAKTRLEDDQLLVSIQDSGVGIKPDQIAQIFDRFHQAEGSEATGYAGTGIGLALVKEVVELHAGHIQVESEYGKGTTFTISIPRGQKYLDQSEGASEASGLDDTEDEALAPTSRAQQMSEEMSKQTVEEQSAEVEQYNLVTLKNLNPRQPKILYVDDNSELRRFVRGVLAESYNVFLGINGLDGFHKALEYDVDLILSDLMMPVADGAQFLKMVREDLRLKTVPFVVLTAKTSATAKIEELDRGADDFLSKPFSEQELLARIRNLVRLREQQQRIKRDLQAAREIQHSLLPAQRQNIGNITIEVLYRPSEELSGDFFDIIQVQDWIYFYVADVTSHGTASAQVTYLVKGIFKDELKDDSPIALPELVMRVASRYMDYRLNYAVGLQVGRYHLSSHTLEYASSNAPEALHFCLTQPNGPLSAEVVSPPPGPTLLAAPTNTETGASVAAPDADSPRASAPNSAAALLYKTVQRQLSAGESFCCFTDGLFEFNRFDTQQEFGYRRFLRLLQTAMNEESKVDGWQQALLQQLEKAHGSKAFPDDMTLFRLKVEN